MALGLSPDYTWDDIVREVEAGQWDTFDYVWTDQPLVNEICEAWGITRVRFIKSLAAPKPGTIFHLVMNDELIKRGYEPLPKWPQGRGLIIPVWQNKTITEIKFHAMADILKPRRIKAAA